MRWGVAGTGQISWTVAPDLGQIGADIVAVYSRNAKNAAGFADAFSIPHSTDTYDSFLHDPNIDIVYLATPITTHFDLASAAIMAGKAVLVEKPMANSAAQSRQLFGLAAEHGVFVMEAMWMKFNPTFRALLDTIAAGTIGATRSVRAGFGFPFPEGPTSKWDPARSGGALLDQGIYPATLAHAVFGTPTRVTAAGRVRADGLDLGEHATLQYPDGSFAHIASAIDEFIDPTATVNGSAGWITIPAPFWPMTEFAVHGTDHTAIFGPPQRTAPAQQGNGYIPMLRAVEDAVSAREHQHPTHPPTATIEVFETLDEIRKQIVQS